MKGNTGDYDITKVIICISSITKISGNNSSMIVQVSQEHLVSA